VMNGSRSAWMDAGAATTTSSSSACGGTVKHIWVYLCTGSQRHKIEAQPCRVLRLV
jgi:hypothetical protein